MALMSDCCSDPPGIKVRPGKGKEAVSYLSPGIFTSSMSYVFGPLIGQLEELGYTEKNLKCAPYDFRIPFHYLEERDGYFTELEKMIEELVEVNQKPVVLTAHSMGNKIAHYFLQKVQKEKGQSWIDKHIHTFFAIGAPWLGAPKAIRALGLGERYGLDFFLKEEEALRWGRTLGGFFSLFPFHLQDLYFGHPQSSNQLNENEMLKGWTYYREHGSSSKIIPTQEIIQQLGCSVISFESF